MRPLKQPWPCLGLLRVGLGSLGRDDFQQLLEGLESPVPEGPYIRPLWNTKPDTFNPQPYPKPQTLLNLQPSTLLNPEPH